MCFHFEGQIKLYGKAYDSNGEWKFNYRGAWIYVENRNDLPNWVMENHGRPFEISGTLYNERLPRVDQIGLKSKRDLKKTIHR